MGYYVTLVNCDITLKPEADEAVVVQHIKDTMFTEAALVANKGTPNRFPTTGNVFEDYWYAWVNNGAVLGATTLKAIVEEFLDACRYNPKTKELSCDHDNKTGDEEILFRTLAPFIVKGSEMEWRGECGEHFLWAFNGETLKVYEGEVVYPEQED